MHRPACPFAAALFGSIVGSAAGAASGAASGWIAFVVYALTSGRDAQSLALLVFGTLGMGVGGSGGAVGGMIEGWALTEAGGPREALAAKWGAGLGGLWSLQPILWLAFTAEPSAALAWGVGVAAVVVGLGTASGMIGGLAARSVIRAMGVGRASALPIRRCGR